MSGKHARRIPGVRVEDIELKFAAHLVDPDQGASDRVDDAEHDLPEASHVDSPSTAARPR